MVSLKSKKNYIILEIKGVLVKGQKAYSEGRAIAWLKHHGFSINDGQVGDDSIPRVVFEVGFAHPYYAEQRLLSSLGSVGLVVLGQD